MPVTFSKNPLLRTSCRSRSDPQRESPPLNNLVIRRGLVHRRAWILPAGLKLLFRDRLPVASHRHLSRWVVNPIVVNDGQLRPTYAIAT